MSTNNLQNVLSGKRVVVVGASSGMGLAVAKASAAQGAHVILCSRSLERLNQVQVDVEGSAEVAQVDMLDEASVEALFGATLVFRVKVYAKESFRPPRRFF